MPKKQLPLYLDQDLIDQLQAEADKQSRSRNGMIEFILKEYLAPPLT